MPFQRLRLIDPLDRRNSIFIRILPPVSQIMYEPDVEDARGMDFQTPPPTDPQKRAECSSSLAIPRTLLASPKPHPSKGGDALPRQGKSFTW